MIAPELLAAYRETEYQVGGPSPLFPFPPFVLRIDEFSPELARLHALHKVACSSFITAANPHSEPLAPAVNAQRLRQLENQLRAMSLNFLQGQGRHPQNGWPAEASLLVPGLALAPACKLARQWEQNALVYSGADAIARLVLL